MRYLAQIRRESIGSAIKDSSLSLAGTLAPLGPQSKHHQRTFFLSKARNILVTQDLAGSTPAVLPRAEKKWASLVGKPERKEVPHLLPTTEST